MRIAKMIIYHKMDLYCNCSYEKDFNRIFSSSRSTVFHSASTSETMQNSKTNLNKTSASLCNSILKTCYKNTENRLMVVTLMTTTQRFRYLSIKMNLEDRPTKLSV